MSAGCIACVKEASRRYIAKNRTRIQEKERSKNSTVEGKARLAARWATYYDKNKEHLVAKAKQYRESTPLTAEQRAANVARAVKWQQDNKERRSKIALDWAKNNPGKANAQTARRRAQKLRATPAWADDFVIKEIYELAQIRGKATGLDHHVDHIVPLRSTLVCGLHCEFNLRVIPGRENESKSNRYWPDMP